MKYLQYTIVLVLFSFAGCKKYLDVEPRGKFIPKYIDDYETVLNSTNILTNGFATAGLNPIDDIHMIVDISGKLSEEDRMYLWNYDASIEVDKSPSIWSPLYTSIYYTNIVLNGVMNASGGSEEKKKQLYAEALVSKAFVYHNLLQYYAKPYDDASAETDPGVPLITSIDVSETAPARSSVKQCHDTIIAYLERAVPDLPEKNENNFRATKNAAYGLLSRVYMSMRKYNKALEYAEKVLQTQTTLVDYNSFPFDSIGGSYTIVPTEKSSEEIWVRLADYSYGLYGGYYSPELVALFGGAEKDFRIKLFSYEDEGKYAYSRYPIFVNMAISVAEVMLNKAEALARNNNVAEAMTLVNTIRKNRLVKEAYTALAANNKEEALTKVLEERRRELAVKGVRWMDMRRLDMENKMPAVKRYDADNKVIATLEPRSKNYVFQIPVRVINLNPNIKPNEY